MKIVTNEKLINRNIRLGFATTIVAILILVVLVWITQDTVAINYLLWTGLLFVAFILAQIGSALSRYGRRSDLTLNDALSKLNKDFTLYHHSAPAPHVLVGPTGLWMLVPKTTRGKITYNTNKNRWKRSGGGIGGLFEGLGRPDVELGTQADSIDRYLSKYWDEDDNLFVNAAIVFTHDSATVDAKGAPVPTIVMKDLRKTVAAPNQKTGLRPAQVKKLNALFGGTD
ncbi:MAG: hypothetical protein DWQ07_02970 [Chloroflexi bacterium]|nr:MAG: hypothetical protein DWQ07_02970 [Chloroflexota bacterium]MBL1193538.1 hypothetical protein [Chloroflexota bacterium]NOH10829.1 hypothetical protein [Chloroflexota bacterium]